MAVMNVFWALITMIGRSGRKRLMRGNSSNALSSGITHVGDDEIALAGGDPAPQAGDRARRPHFVTGARKRLVEDSSNRRVVVGD